MSERKTIALLTPYTGGNLGDGAIQDAVLEQLRARLPGANFCMLTLDPVRTVALHGVCSLPLTGVFVSNYSSGLRQSFSKGSGDGRKNRRTRTLLGVLKKHPTLRRIFRRPWVLGKSFFISFVWPATEVRHSLAMYRMLRSCCLLVVSGGGQIDDYWGGPMGHPYSLFKWASLARLANVPMVMLSVGVCTLDSWLSKYFVRVALTSAAYRSYRDVRSKKLLAWARCTHTDRVLPDLAYSYSNSSAENDLGPSSDRPELRIGVSPIAYLLDGSWPKNDDGMFNAYFDCLTVFIEQLLSRGHKVVLFATDDSDWDVVTILREKILGRAEQVRVGKLRAVKHKSADQCVSELSKLDCVVASRLHGIILSHVCLRPVVAVSYDRKVTDYMSEAGQAEYCLDIHSVTADALYRAFDRLRAARERITAAIAQLRQRYSTALTEQYDEVTARIKNWRWAGGVS